MVSFFNSLFPDQDGLPAFSREDTGNRLEELMQQSALTQRYPRLEVCGVETTDMPREVYFKILIVPGGGEGKPHNVMKCYKQLVEFHSAVVSECPSTWLPQLPTATPDMELTDRGFLLRLGDYLECIACNVELRWSAPVQSFFHLSNEYQESEASPPYAAASDVGSSVDRSCTQVPLPEAKNWLGSAHGLKSVELCAAADISCAASSACAPSVPCQEAFLPLGPSSEEHDLCCNKHPSVFSLVNSCSRGVGSEATTSASSSQSTSTESLLTIPTGCVKKKQYLLPSLPLPLVGSSLPQLASVVTPKGTDLRSNVTDVGGISKSLPVSAFAGRCSMERPPVAKHIQLARDARKSHRNKLASTVPTASKDIQRPSHTLLASQLTPELVAAATQPKVAICESRSDVTPSAPGVKVGRRLTSVPSQSPAGTESMDEIQQPVAAVKLPSALICDSRSDVALSTPGVKVGRKLTSVPFHSPAGTESAGKPLSPPGPHVSSSEPRNNAQNKLLPSHEFVREPALARDRCHRDTVSSAQASAVRGNPPLAAALSRTRVAQQMCATHHDASCSAGDVHSGAAVPVFDTDKPYSDPSEQSYSFELLCSRQNRPADVDPTCKEKYLSAHEFKAVFGMDHASFAKLPRWKQLLMKQSRDLF